MDKKTLEDDDIKLMLDFQKGDESCFTEILNKYEKPLINFIYRFIGNRVDAEDIAQEVFLRIYKSKNNYKPKAKFSTWLYKIACDLCIDYQRKRKIKTVPLDNLVNTDEGEIVRETTDIFQGTPDVLSERKQISKTIKSCLLSLPNKQRLAISLRVYENKSYQEISKILGCSVSAVESLLFRARLSLRNKLSHVEK
jgi:RNA polymerase sigma-70 factor (ECF subfamily)